MSQEQLALQARIEQLTLQNELMKCLRTRKGFCEYYFKQLPKFSTNEEAFNHVNDEHLELFGEYRYSDYDSFKQTIRWYHKQ